MRRHHNRLDKIESAASPDREEIHVYFRPPEGADLPPEAESLEDPIKHSTTGEWMDAASREWHEATPGVRICLTRVNEH
jgi:hypothetical protein